MAQAGSEVLPAPDLKPMRWVSPGWSMSDKNLEQERQIIYKGEMTHGPWKFQLTRCPCKQQDVSHTCSLLGGSSSTVAVWSKEGMQPMRCVACTEQKRGGGEACVWKRRKWHRRKRQAGQSVSMTMEENREKTLWGNHVQPQFVINPPRTTAP